MLVSRPFTLAVFTRCEVIIADDSQVLPSCHLSLSDTMYTLLSCYLLIQCLQYIIRRGVSVCPATKDNVP